MMNVINEDFENDLDFGLDPHVLPQFDLLVADGRITREYADQVIAARREAGLPMTPSELQPRPEPLVDALVWVKALGGPDIRASSQHNGSVLIQDLDWRWQTYSSEKSAELTAHFVHDGEHLGWISLYPGSSNSCVHWSHYKILDRKPGEESGKDVLLSVDAKGQSSDFFAALNDALAWDFVQVSAAGHNWYRTSDKSLSVPGWGGVEMTVRMVDEFTLRPGRTVSWIWDSSPSRLREFFALLNIHNLSGYAATQEDAMADASGVICKVLVAAHQLVGDGDAFAAGKAAGRAEFKAEISRLD